jgi:hypothetical protein
MQEWQNVSPLALGVSTSRVYYETRALRQTRLAKLPSADGEAVTD